MGRLLTLIRARARTLGVLVALALVGAAAVPGWRWWSAHKSVETTNDAYVQADSTIISALVTGDIVAVAVADNQLVHKGDFLAQIDDRSYRFAALEAEAAAQADETDIRNLIHATSLQGSLIDEARADVTAADSNRQFAEEERDRYARLSQAGFGSVQRMQQALSELHSREAAEVRATAGVEAARKQLDDIKGRIARAELMLAADLAKRDLARLQLQQTRIVAPFTGIVGNNALRVGELVELGTRLLTLVPTQDLYVVANFKETQIGRMRPGQRTTIRIDSFPGWRLGGAVLGLAPASSNTFSLLPSENATGNFTKIAQRVAVKIKLTPPGPYVDRLRPGLSATVSVDTRDLSR